MNSSPGLNNTPFTDRPLSLNFLMLRRKQLLQDQCFRKPQNPLYIEEADFSRFIVIEKLRFVFCFIPKVSCVTWKRVLYAAENMGKATGFNPHKRILFKWLSDYTPSKRKEILDSYYKAMFVRHPFERLASAYRDKKKKKWFQRLIYPENEELWGKIKFSAFIRRELLTRNKTTLQTNQHWRSYEQICPCEVKFDFIGHFENLFEEAGRLLNIIGVYDYVKFPEYRPSKTQPYMQEYYSELTTSEISQLYEIFELDFKLYGYDRLPGPLEKLIKNTTVSEKSNQENRKDK